MILNFVTTLRHSGTNIEKNDRTRHWRGQSRTAPEPLGCEEMDPADGYNMRLIIYKILSILLLADLFAVILFLTVRKLPYAYVSLAIVLAILLAQVLIIKCRCGCRPGLKLLAIWTILVDFELYIADTLLLNKCPKCKGVLNQRD